MSTQECTLQMQPSVLSVYTNAWKEHSTCSSSLALSAILTPDMPAPPLRLKSDFCAQR